MKFFMKSRTILVWLHQQLTLDSGTYLKLEAGGTLLYKHRAVVIRLNSVDRLTVMFVFSFYGQVFRAGIMVARINIFYLVSVFQTRNNRFFCVLDTH